MVTWCCASTSAISANSGPANATGPQHRGDTPTRVEQLAVTWDYGENVLDLEPQGPLPPQIYWRRRALALGIGLLVVALVVFGGIALFGGSDSKNTDKTSTAI